MDTNTVKAHVVATDTRGRRITPRQHRSVEQKRSLVIESQQPGASVAEIARRNGVNANLLFVWRRLHERGLLEARTRRGGSRRLMPVKLLESTTAAAQPPVQGALRVRFAAGIELVIDGSPDAALLERVIALLRC
ncbi:MAG: transposase [Steroidobacteraceae bacterium]